jgi:hypothetical protein
MAVVFFLSKKGTFEFALKLIFLLFKRLSVCFEYIFFVNCLSYSNNPLSYFVDINTANCLIEEICGHISHNC